MSEVDCESVNGAVRCPAPAPDLQLIVDSVPGLVCYVNREYRYTFLNRRYSEWFGRPTASFLGKNVAEVLGADGFEYVKPYIDEAFCGNTPSFDRYQTYNGSPPRYVRTTIVPDLASDGSVRGAVVLVEDISDRKRAEDAEKELKRQLTLLLDASGSLLASPDTADVLRTILDLAKRFIHADAYSVWRQQGEAWQIIARDGLSANYSAVVGNRGASNLENRRPIVVEDVETSSFLAGRLEAYRAEGIRALITVPLQIHNVINGTLVFYYRDGHNFSELELRVASALGNLAAAAIGTADLYRRQSELRELAESNEQRSAFLAEAGQILSSSLDFDRTLASLVDLAVPRFADVAAVELLDSAGEARRVALKHVNPAKLDFVKDFRRRFPPLENDIVQTAMHTGKSTLIEDIPDEVYVQRARNPEHLEALRYFGVKSLILAPLIANNRIFGLLSFVSAESGRRYSRADLGFAEELARRAASAMDNARLFTESTQAQLALRRSNAELSHANEDLNQFAYSVSHDLQEPLRMLAIYSQLLHRKYEPLLDDQACEYLRFIVEGAKRMEMLLSDLLAYMQVLNIPSHPTDAIDTNKVLKQVIQTLAMSISESGAVVEFDDLPPVAVQEFHLVQLFQNLISNAVKYRSEKPPRIRVSCGSEGTNWKICVKDNGIGIAPQYCEQVFKVFRRLHDKDKYPGTGIGLAICQKIVEGYGGKIWIESVEGSGSTVCILLPSVSAGN